LGIRPVSLGPGEATIELTAGPHLHNAMGTVHGGVFGDLADVAMGAALATVADIGESFATLHLDLNYFHAVREGRLTATAKVVRRGRGGSNTTAHVTCDLHDEQSRLVARATSVAAISRRE
jgi:uncharacterized protein (TIGR00369 family)